MKKYLPDEENIVMSREQVRAFDAWAINELGIDGTVLMENAGRSCAEFIKEKLTGKEQPKVCIFCGTGNNGGDGYVIARHLLNSGFRIVVVICGNINKISGDAKKNLDIWKGLRQSFEILDIQADNLGEKVSALCDGADMLVDTIFGTGLRGQLRSDYIELINSINAQDKPVLAVDIPSGLDCDSAEVLGAAIIADWTITFAAVKKGFTSPQSAKYTGEVFVASIGTEPASQKQA